MPIAIIGGGPSGLFTAIALNRLKYEVLVLEAGTYQEQRAGEHLDAKGRSLMNTLEIPAEILENNSIACKEILGAWGQEEVISRSSIFNPYGDGLILSRPAFDQSLAGYCKTLGIRIETNFRVRTLDRKGSGWEISDGEQHFNPEFVVDASGRNSKFASALQSIKTDHDDLIGITKVLRPVKVVTPLNSQLLIEPTPNGWWYSVQLQSGELTLTFMTNAKIFTSYEQKEDAFWQEELKHAQNTFRRSLEFYSSPQTFTQSAKTTILDQMVGEHWLAVGDAAMSFDPLSSSGILKGVRMGISAANQIHAWRNGNTNALEIYAQECRDTFAEYMEKKQVYYALEKRFNAHPFWYSRNIIPQRISNFRILPHHHLMLNQNNPDERLRYLSEKLPQVDFYLLLDCIVEQPIAHLFLKKYLEKKGEVMLSNFHFQALESMEMTGILSVALTQ